MRISLSSIRFTFRNIPVDIYSVVACDNDYNSVFCTSGFFPFSPFLGGDGRTANKRADRGAGVAVRNVRRLHYLPGIGAYLRVDDKHVSFAQCRSYKQAASIEARNGIAARENARLHRTGLGVLHGLRTVPFPRRGSYSLLGQVLGLLLHRRHCQHRDSYSCAHSIRCIRCSLLSLFGSSQM